MAHMAVMVNLRAGIAPMASQAWAMTASPTVGVDPTALAPAAISLIKGTTCQKYSPRPCRYAVCHPDRHFDCHFGGPARSRVGP